VSDTAVEVLARLAGLREASPQALAGLAEQFDVMSSPAGALVCDEGAPAETLYVLVKGTVEVRKRSISGHEHVVAELTAPCMFGHVGVLSLAERTASIRAKGDVELLRMSARRARVIIRTGEFAVASPFRRALIVAMCQQLTSATAAVASLAVEAGVAEEGPAEVTRVPPAAEEDRTEAEDSMLPDDAEVSLLKGLSQV